MAEPPIKSRLESTELSTNPSPIQNRLNACLAFDAAHIQPGQKGDHVKVIQQALNTIRKRRPDIAMIEINDAPGTWGDDTTNAVIRYKSFNHIIRTLQKLDPIVGRMTLTQLDNDLLKPVPPPPPSPAKDESKSLRRISKRNWRVMMIGISNSWRASLKMTALSILDPITNW